MNALLPVFALAVVAAFVGAGVLGAFNPRPEMIWQDSKSVIDCGSTYDSQAVVLTGQSVDSGKGCRSTWFVFLPATEGGDTSAQLQYLTSHRNEFKGVLMDDFGSSGSSYSALTSIFGPSSVCPVLYLPTADYPCEVAVVPPTVYYQWFTFKTNGTAQGSDYFVNSTTPLQDVSVQQWTAATRWFVKQFMVGKTTTVFTLVYGARYSLWSYPLPKDYVQGVSQAGPNVVVWH